MGRKKRMKGIDEEDRLLIEEAMSKNSSKCNTDNFVSYNFSVKFKCKTEAQKSFVKMLKDPDKTIVVGAGSAGTGKSYVSLATALQMVGKVPEGCEKPIKQIIIVIPTVPAGGADAQIGFLPGTIDDKLSQFKAADIQTITKILRDSDVKNPHSVAEGLIRNNIITYEIVSYIRGRNFDNAIILVNEAEDFSLSEMYSIITRLGDSSKLWITGDTRQCDRKLIKKSSTLNSGIEFLMSRFKYLPEYGCVEFFPEDIVRNGLITKMILLWDMTDEEIQELENMSKDKEITPEEEIITEKPKKRGRPKKVKEEEVSETQE